MIEIRNLTKRYKDLIVYENFDFSLEEGKITCLLGRSGCGKTTLMNILAGLTDCEGQVPELKCSYIFQSPTLVPSLTVKGNLALVCKDADRIGEMINRIGLKGKENSYPVNLSGGEAQRVSIARAFLAESEALLMDEPFVSLDIKIKDIIMKLFMEIWREDGRTVFFVTHDTDEAIGLAHRIVVLSEGKIVYDETPSSPVPRDIGSEEKLRSELIDALLK